MTTYVVGDIQGCFQPFECLLEKVAFDATCDQIWSVGDLINRGPRNLDTLRWFYRHRHCATVVLGNHDLHLLAVHAGAAEARGSDNFHDILNAPDCAELLDWLQRQPLMHGDRDNLLVHAGIPPQWSPEEAMSYAAEVEAVLRSERAPAYFRAMYGDEPWCWSPHLDGMARLRVITNYFTRMRFCSAEGGLDLKSKGPTPKSSTLNGYEMAPWFSHPSNLKPRQRVFFGHWAALNGCTNSEQFIGLDTGCVWGQKLTFFVLETGQFVSASCDPKI